MDSNTPEIQTPEVRYGEISKSVKEWAESHGVDYAKSMTRTPEDSDAGEWQTPDGEKFHVYASLGRVAVIEGDESEMKKYIIEIGDDKRDQTLKYLEGPSNLMGTGAETKIGWYGEPTMMEYADRKANTDVFEPMEAITKKLQAAQKITS